MDLGDVEGRAACAARLGRVFAGRRVVHGPRVLAAVAPELDLVARHGATASLVVATVRGAGEVPAADAAGVVWLPGRSFGTVSEEVRAEDERVRTMPPEVVAAVEAFDPDRSALWLGGPFVGSDEPVLGRPVLNGRRASWLALEDKVLADHTWAAAGVAHAPHRVVPAEPEALEDASAALDEGSGVVWSGDASDGLNGGGDLVRWVADADERADAAAYLSARCERVRVQPFLEGAPCSIHGYVAEDGTAAFRPVEISMLRRGHCFVYGGLSSFWDPPDADRDVMRSAVRRVGEHLRERVGYRGFFGIDGVLTAGGFLPTELNPRHSAGAMIAFGALEPRGLAVLLQVAATAGPVPLTAAEVESVVPALDAARCGRVMAPWHGDFDVDSLGPDGEERLTVSYDGHDFVEDPAGDVLAVGRNDSGLLAFVRECSALAPGVRLAPLNSALMRFADARWGTAFGDTSPAPEVRT